MKNVKVLFGLLMLFVVATTSCKKESDFLPFDDFADETSNQNNDNNQDEASENALTLYRVADNEIIKVKDYPVAGNLKSLQSATLKHQDMWSFFKKMIPENERRFISEFEVFYGGNELAGYVAPIDVNDLSSWKMGLAIDLAENLDKVDLQDEFTYTCIHEFGHILTLNDTQVDAAVGEQSCDHYFTGEGCSGDDSYINRIFELGWEDIIAEFNRIETDAEAEDFYQKYADRFVTPYASSNPGEDVAEVFTIFVTQDNPPTGNTIADQKVQAMYSFPELVQLRNKIRTQPQLRTLKPGSWVKNNKRKKCKHHTH